MEATLITKAQQEAFDRGAIAVTRIEDVGEDPPMHRITCDARIHSGGYLDEIQITLHLPADGVDSLGEIRVAARQRATELMNHAAAETRQTFPESFS